MEFQQLGLGKAIVKALNDMDFRHPTKVQKIAIPSVISGKDVIVSSMTVLLLFNGRVLEKL